MFESNDSWLVISLVLIGVSDTFSLLIYATLENNGICFPGVCLIHSNIYLCAYNSWSLTSCFLISDRLNEPTIIISCFQLNEPFFSKALFRIDKRLCFYI